MAYNTILTGATSASGAPTQGTAPANTDATGYWLRKGGHAGTNLGLKGPDFLVWVKSTAGSGTMTCKVRLWGWIHAASSWFPLGPEGGLMNEGVNIEETAADKIHHAELVVGLDHFDGLYAELVTVTGTATAISVGVA